MFSGHFTSMISSSIKSVLSVARPNPYCQLLDQIRTVSCSTKSVLSVARPNPYCQLLDQIRTVSCSTKSVIRERLVLYNTLKNHLKAKYRLIGLLRFRRFISKVCFGSEFGRAFVLFFCHTLRVSFCFFFFF